MQLKEAHVVVFFSHGSQHPMQWQQNVTNGIMGSYVFVTMDTT
jgi:hypothetical protein